MPYRIVNPHRQSNSFLLPLDHGKAAIIDVGNFDQQLLHDWLEKQQLELVAAIITHEHSDHCMGLPSLLENFKLEIFCSERCARNMADSRQNFSHYMEEVDTFVANVAYTEVTNDSVFTIGGRDFHFLLTPGHSPGGICFHTGSLFFTGDTILNGRRTPLTFPHSNKKDYALSLDKIKERLLPGVTLMPGHGEPFVFSDFSSLHV